jgi:two-component system, NtrC family, sensor kinase
VDADLSGLTAKAELLELLLSATPDGIIDWDLLSNRVDYNPRFRHMLGYDDDELAPQSATAECWQDLIHPEDRAATQKLLGEHLEQGWPFTTTMRMRHGSGGYRHIMCRGSAQRDVHERPVRMLIILSDIDDRIRDEIRQRALVSAVPDTLFRVQSNGRISGVKRGLERDGSPFVSLKEGLTLADCIGDAGALARLKAALLADLGGAPQSALTVQITTSTAEASPLHHEVRIVRSGDDESVCIVRDVTEQRELQGRLLETEKLGAIGQLAAGVAHEINTPMQFIGDNLHYARGALGDLVGLLERYKAAVQAAESALGPDQLQELAQAEDDADFAYSRNALPTALERSLSGVQRVTNIVRAMKSFAHPGGDQLEPTDLKS